MFSFTYLKLAIYAAVFAAGAYVSYSFMSGLAARKELAYEHERLEATQRYAAAEKSYRETESAWRADVAAREAAYQEARALRDSRIAALNATNSKLRDAIAAARAGSPSTDPGAAIGDLQKRVDALGSLLVDLDGMAGESARVADILREELALCRDYTKALQ